MDTGNPMELETGFQFVLTRSKYDMSLMHV